MAIKTGPETTSSSLTLTSVMVAGNVSRHVLMAFLSLLRTNSTLKGD